MRYGSVCSGIGAAELAWSQLGWDCKFASEIEPFARRVFEKNHDIDLQGDFREIEYDGERLDLLVGGTPCQEFSMAGWRRGMDGARGELSMQYLNLVESLEPSWIVWENVPGVLSSNGGRDFGTFLTALAELGYNAAWRVLDAKDFGVPQQRQRVILIAHHGDWRAPAAVLFNDESENWYHKPSETPGSYTSPYSLRTFKLFRLMGFGNYKESEVAGPIKSRDFKSPTDLIIDGGRVRRWTPTEYERLMGFPSDYTAVAWKGKPASRCPMEPRVRVLGNSMAVPMMYLVGRRIQNVQRLLVSKGSR